MITKETLARTLDGREYPMRLSKEELQTAELSKLVIVTGASDDLIEFEGAISDEQGAPGDVYVTHSGPLPEHDECKCEFCGFKQMKKHARKIDILWCAEPNISWTIKTDIPHATFNVMEDGEVFCRGIVFSMGDL